MKALVGAFNQEKALVGAFSVIVQPVVEPMEHYTALIYTLQPTELRVPTAWRYQTGDPEDTTLEAGVAVSISPADLATWRSVYMILMLTS